MPHFDSSFDFVAFFIIFKKFVWILLGTYCHLLLNSSWDAHYWCNIKRLNRNTSKVMKASYLLGPFNFNFKVLASYGLHKKLSRFNSF
jgi:hypothetical protein